MELVNRTENNSLEILENKVNECRQNKTLISIHIYTNNMEIHNIVSPDIFEVFEDSICIMGGWFELRINKEFQNVIYDEEENVIILQDEDKEINIEL